MPAWVKRTRLAKAPEPVQKQLQLAKQQFKKNQYQSAIKSLNGILKFHRNTESGDDALFLLAKTYSRTENWDKALGAYKALYDSQYYSSRELPARMATIKILTYKTGDYKQSLKIIDNTLRKRIPREQKADLLELRFTNLMKTGAQLEAFENSRQTFGTTSCGD